MEGMQEEQGKAAARAPELSALRLLLRPGVASALGLSALWLIPAFVVGFAGEIALNDDYAYAWTVRTAVEEGIFHRIGPTWVPIVTTTSWGALFALPAGFSFGVLRFSSWVAGGLGIWATHWLLRENGADLRAAFLGAAVLAVNPVYVNLAFTFMTDVPYIALTTASLAAFARNLRTGSVAALALGATLAVAATLTRQIGLALPIAFAFAVLIGAGQSRRVTKATVVGTVVMAGYGLFLASQIDMGAGVYSVADLGRQIGRRGALWHGARNMLEALALLGAFTSPSWLGCARRDAGGSGSLQAWSRSSGASCSSTTLPCRG